MSSGLQPWAEIVPRGTVFFQPKVLSTYPRCAHPTRRTAGWQGLLHLGDALVQRLRRRMRPHIALAMAPEMLHGMQRGTGHRQPPSCNAPLVREPEGCVSFMGRGAVQAQEHRPASPQGADQVPMCLQRLLMTLRRVMEKHTPSHTHRPREDASLMLTKNRHERLRALPCPWGS